MSLRGLENPAICLHCGSIVDPQAAQYCFDTCTACSNKLTRAFIAGFGLVEGEHYGLDGAGEVDCWDGDVTLIANAVWLTVCDRADDWASTPLEDLVEATREALYRFHGQLPPPFGLEVDPGLCEACSQDVMVRCSITEDCACLICDRCGQEGLKQQRCPVCGVAFVTK
jgi:hypothetical protein